MNRLFAPALVHQAGRRGQRGGRVDDRRQHLEIDADRIGEVLRLGAGRRDAGGDGARRHSAPCALPAADSPTTLNPFTCGTARISARRGRSRAVKTRPSASGGMVMPLMRACACGLRTKATSCVFGSLHVGDELAAAVQVARVLLAQQRGADAKPGAGRGMHHALALWCVAPASASSPPASVAAAALMAVTILV